MLLPAAVTNTSMCVCLTPACRGRCMGLGYKQNIINFKQTFLNFSPLTNL